jgi:acyl-CoA synthetase (AMP-forming)/AMP-acid ligase II
LAWATHRLGGVQSPANAQYSVDEVVYQLKDSEAKCIFTCIPLLQATIEAAVKVGIPKNRIYILEMPAVLLGGAKAEGFTTLSDLVARGKKLPELEPLKWSKGEGARRAAFLCYSSGTSGLPVRYSTRPLLLPSPPRNITDIKSQKGVMISHYNVISNILQICKFDQHHRDMSEKAPGEKHYQENCLGLLPMSHIYSLVVISHCSPFRGDGCVILPKFDMQLYLNAIQKFKINSLYLVPPIIIVSPTRWFCKRTTLTWWNQMMAKNKAVLDQFDLSSVKVIFTGAAPLGKETADELSSQYPNWLIRQGYGLTETSTVVCSTSGHDIWFGSSGSLLPLFECKLVVPESGQEVTAYDTPGELWVKSPSVTLGYFKKQAATDDTYVTDAGGRWMKTGDEAVVRVAPSGHEHIFITDRIKELIKVKVCPMSHVLLTCSLVPSTTLTNISRVCK